MNNLNPQNPDSPLYQFVDTQPPDEFPCNPDSSFSHFTTRQFIPTAITASWPVIVYILDHGFSNGQVVRTSMFIRRPIANATGMEQLNNRTFYVQNTTQHTFALYDKNGVAIDGRNYTPYISGGQFILIGPDLPIVNPSEFPPSGIPAFPPE